MKKWLVGSAFFLLAAGVAALGTLSVQIYQENRSYQESLAAEYQANWEQLWEITDLAASLYGENHISREDAGASDVWQHVVMTKYLYLVPEVRVEALTSNDLVRIHYLNLAGDLDDPERKDTAMPLFQKMNRDLHELSHEMTENYSENTADMLEPESAACQQAEAQIRSFMEKYIGSLAEYFGYQLS